MGNKPSGLMLLGYAVYSRVRARITADCGGVCTYCGIEVIIGRRAYDRCATIDHKVPMSRGGTSKRYNLTCACKRCNTEKGAMTVEEYAAWRETQREAVSAGMEYAEA